ncbi:antitoxin family protein [Archaeoglobus sp. UBA230]|jgi:predicted DNA-binding antitoxin AbrB/MazE fold protein|uniref:antitoxin family protein n=1 Tax=Archaeoglobus sp. UBA230 TaxID=1915565 RepID=UPI0025B99656|nr:antitoxin family protein [Archaeoglobus sp. UBA230]
MPKIIEAIYEDGVFKPLEKVDLREGEKVRLRVEERGAITPDLIEKLKLMLKNIPETMSDVKGLEEQYYAGKMLY